MFFASKEGNTLKFFLSLVILANIISLFSVNYAYGQDIGQRRVIDQRNPIDQRREMKLRRASPAVSF